MAESTSGVGEGTSSAAASGATVQPTGADSTPAELAPWELAPMEDGFIRRFVGALVHARRYAKFYLVGAGWLVVMVLVQPFDAPGEVPADAAVGLAGHSGTVASSRAPAGTSAAPASSAVEVADDFAYTPYELTAALDDPAETATSAPAAPAASSSSSVVPGVPSADDVVPLRIEASGYAAIGAGTPADTTPDGGLPVAVTAGSESKRSFIRLSGTEPLLRLALADADHRFSEVAQVMACPITGDWAPERGMAMSDSPAFDCAGGVLASVDGAVFSFDLSTVSDHLDGMSFALVAYVASDPTITFEVTFDDAVVTNAG